MKVNREQLLTLICEIEAVINSRPLIYIDNDINSQDVLTPAHFLSINLETGVPDVEVNYSPGENLSKELMETWKRGQIHLNSCWTIWSNEYLQSVRERHTLNMKPIKGEITQAPKLGEIVIIKEEGLSQGSWKLSRIEKLIESGIDGAQRAAILITPNGKLIIRPLRLIYPLEGNNVTEKTAEVVTTMQSDKINQEIPDTTKIDERPTRLAAKLADEKI